MLTWRPRTLQACGRHRGGAATCTCPQWRSRLQGRRQPMGRGPELGVGAYPLFVQLSSLGMDLRSCVFIA